MPQLAREDGREVWERLPKEPVLWFERFAKYRDTPTNERTFVDVYRTVAGKPKAKNTPGTWRKAIVRFKWKERAECWDAFRDEARRATAIAEVESAARRQAEIASDYLEALAEPARALLRRLGADKSRKEFREALDALEPGDLLELVRKVGHALPVVANMQRLALGLPVEITESAISGKDGAPPITVDDLREPAEPMTKEEAAEVAAILEEHGALELVLLDGEKRPKPKQETA
jgi:hypothetical protein